MITRVSPAALLIGSALLMKSIAMAADSQPPASKSGPASQPELEWHRAQLPSGARLIIVHAPLAKRQTTYSLLPVHLGNDDAGRAQWSHLLEHMLIRTTDAEGLQAEGIIFDGETTDSYLRLETIAEPAHWKDALARQAKWLTARAFDPQRLEREKGMIAQEEQSTAANGFTDKFAIAAWNQIVACGRDRALVHGDVQNAAADDVTDYAASRMRLDSSAVIASIGPTPAAEIEAELIRLLGEAVMQAPPPRAVDQFQPPTSQPMSLHATWDLPTRHVLWWWPLPDRRPETIAAATGASRALVMRVRARKDVARALRSMQAHPLVTTQQGSFIVIDACITNEAKPEELDRAMRECAAALCDRALPASTQSIVFGARLAAQEFSPATSLAQLAKQVPPHLRDAVEGLWLLSLLNYEFAWGIPAEQAYERLMALDDQAIADMQMRLRAEPRTLTLEPAAPADPK